MTGCAECGDEPPGSGAAELVSQSVLPQSSKTCSTSGLTVKMGR
jgi:hypothetical protein